VAPPAPAPQRREVAAAAPSSASSASRLDAKTVEQIFSCLAPGLPAEWKRAWVVVTNGGAGTTAKFYYTASYRDQDAEEFTPCNVAEVARRIAAASDAQGSWRSARLSIDSEGAFKLDFE
jgi:hypothetical protein